MKQLILLALAFTACTPATLAPVLTPNEVTLSVASGSATVANGTANTLKTVSIRLEGVTEIFGALKCNPPVQGRTVCLLANTLAPGATTSVFFKGQPVDPRAVFRVGDGDFTVIAPK
jgi:hypothetical protein